MGYYSFDLRSHSFSCSFLKYCISRDIMQSNFFFPRGQELVFIKDWLPHHRLIECFISETSSI